MIAKVTMTASGAERIRELEAQGFEISGLILTELKVAQDGMHRKAVVDFIGGVQVWSADATGHMIEAKE